MSRELFSRVQTLLEETQAKIGAAEERWQNTETQIRQLSGKVTTLEQQIAILRAQAMTAVELAGKTNGDCN